MLAAAFAAVVSGTLVRPAAAEAQDAAAIERADSIRAAMAEVRPAGEQPTDWVDVAGFPIKVALFPIDLVLIRLPALAVGQLTLPAPPGFVVRTIRGAAEAGFRPAFRSSIGPGSGPALGLDVTRFDPVTVEAGISIRGSQRHRVDARFGAGTLEFGIGAGWQRDARIPFYGIGPLSPDRETLYRRETGDVTARATARPTRALTLEVTAGYENDLVREPLGAGDDEALSDVFDPELLFGAADRQEFLRLGVGFGLDFTHLREFQERGMRFLADASVFRGTGDTSADFHRVGLEGQGLLPLNLRQLLALRVRAETTRPGYAQVPFYHLSSFGGEGSAIGYPDRRFTDLDMAIAVAEWRYEVWRDIHTTSRVETFLYFGEGAVARRLDEIESDDWHASYGFGIRAASREGLRGLMYLGFSAENVRFGFGGDWTP